MTREYNRPGPKEKPIENVAVGRSIYMPLKYWAKLKKSAQRNNLSAGKLVMHMLDNWNKRRL